MSILAKCIAVMLCIGLSSCSKNEDSELKQHVNQHEISEDEIERTETSIENVLSLYTGSSVDNFVTQIKELDNVKNVDVDNDLVFITTTAGELISVDLNGTTSQIPITEEERVDTCGTYIESLLDNIDIEIIDSLAEKTESNSVIEDSITGINNDGDESIETRALRVPNRTILSKMNMAIWSPWDEFKRYEESLFSSAVRNTKINATIINNFGPSSFSSFGNYDLVFVSSHGSSDGAICIPQKYWHLYVEPFAKKKEDGKKYIDVNAARQAGIRTHFEKKDNGETLKTVALERIFFENHLPKLTNTIIWTSACHLGRNNSAFLLGALTKGCPEYYGANNVCNSEGPMSAFKQFIPLFANGASTKVAFDNVDIKFRNYNNGKTSYVFVRHGNKNITYVKPFITGVKKISSKYAVIGTQYNFSLDIAGSTNSETPNQLGILLENLNTGNTQKIPLTGSNVKNSRSESWNGSICLYLADVLIDNLTPNTNYRYCTYVIVNNKPFYSEKVQTFKTNAEKPSITIKNVWFTHTEPYTKANDYGYDTKSSYTYSIEIEGAQSIAKLYHCSFGTSWRTQFDHEIPFSQKDGTTEYSSSIIYQSGINYPSTYLGAYGISTDGETILPNNYIQFLGNANCIIVNSIGSSSRAYEKIRANTLMPLPMEAKPSK